MDKDSIKKFVKNARKTLIENIENNAKRIGITEKGAVDPILDGGYIVTFYVESEETKDIKYDQIDERNRFADYCDENDFKTVIEEVAYTWFNRIIAIRFMEVMDYFPKKYRVFSSEIPGDDPDIMTNIYDSGLDLSEDDFDYISDLTKKNLYDELYTFLFFKLCNYLSKELPGLFEKADDYTELLLTLSLDHDNDGLIQYLNDIPKEDFQNQEEIIGLFFEYYAEEREKKLSKKSEQYIPVSYQKFSTNWLVRYMIDNSLGKYWLDRNENSPLKKELKYYIDYQESEKSLEDIPVEELKFFDPCMGSGQILCYAFDVFYQIYSNSAYSPSMIPELILKNNLYGLDIDEFAYQLTYFNVMMKARFHDRDILNKKVTPNIFSIHEDNYINKNMMDVIEKEDHKVALSIRSLKDNYKNVKWYGSLKQIEHSDIDSFEKYINEFFDNISEDLSNQRYIEKIRGRIQTLIGQTRLFSYDYDFVVTNPPYTTKSSRNKTLKTFIENKFELYGESQFSAFMYRNFMFCKKNGYLAMITPTTWMFQEEYETLRDYLFKEKSIVSLVQLSRFDSSDDFTTCAFVMRNSSTDLLSTYISLKDFKGGIDIQKQKFIDATSTKKDYTYQINNNIFNDHSNNILNYWLDNSFSYLNSKTINELADIEVSNINADIHLRKWYEVPYKQINLDMSFNDLFLDYFKWHPFNNGGDFRRWYGLQKDIIYMNREVTRNIRENLSNEKLYNEEFISWSVKSKQLASFRYYNEGFIFNEGNSSIFAYEDMENLFTYDEKEYFFDKSNEEYLLGFLNSSIAQKFLNFLSPPKEYPLKNLNKIPIIIDENFTREIKKLVNENIELCKNDWDNYETSWNFKYNPLIKFKRETLEDSFKAWQEHKLNDFNKLKENEERLNEIFAEIYNMDIECKVHEENVSITKADYEKDIKDLISYVVGCMFGRYSLDEYGIICADNDFDIENYYTFEPYEDNIIPILDTKYFDNDIVDIFIEFIEYVFGEDHINENLDFIVNALDTKGNTKEEKIRNYFEKDFFEYHKETFNNLPIYWQFDSGKMKGFRCLIYLHRYEPDLLKRIRINYLQVTKDRIQNKIDTFNNDIDDSLSSSKRKQINDKIEKLKKQLKEIEDYDNVLSRLANKDIDLNLDEGIKRNYAKFQKIEIKSNEQGSKKVNLLRRI